MGKRLRGLTHPMALKHVTFESSSLVAGSSLTGSYVTILTTTQDSDFLVVACTCDQNIYLELNSVQLSGVVAREEIPWLARQSLVLDFRSLGKRLAAGEIKAKHAGAVPTAGSLAITAGY